MKAGVVSVQGAAPEHVRALQQAMAGLGVKGAVVSVRRPSDLEEVSCLVIPGGESTTISKLLRRFELHDRIVRMAEEGVPMMGTCAGCVLLAKEGDAEVEKTGTRLLGLMDMGVDRNAFGRQRESFEAPLDIAGLEAPFPGVFIRGPVIRKVWGDCKVLSSYGDKIVMARQGNMLALSFHPELSGDSRVHEMLLKMI
ncbi:pyridoxal 5'-phosphate synthase glutaminase subunit PdxT [Methanomassiliicoccus luminyensis]|jgi:5'-phosphate synthase pdxT subunit|uniref:pyridoxal 5'-phosphate synthase glutaminase subunit PdxT n=1 Tax=Methanomassiliicoccus luminyensis TaxID=1080712 RepID=UPI000377EE64|nr:pyridoxal 5'-phosphate synthase glutaminase subunit PdxT [Methanomassiliicoccus luminyensis]